MKVVVSGLCPPHHSYAQWVVTPTHGLRTFNSSWNRSISAAMKAWSAITRRTSAPPLPLSLPLAPCARDFLAYARSLSLTCDA